MCVHCGQSHITAISSRQRSILLLRTPLPCPRSGDDLIRSHYFNNLLHTTCSRMSRGYARLRARVHTVRFLRCVFCAQYVATKYMKIIARSCTGTHTACGDAPAIIMAGVCSGQRFGRKRKRSVCVWARWEKKRVKVFWWGISERVQWTECLVGMEARRRI